MNIVLRLCSIAALFFGKRNTLARLEDGDPCTLVVIIDSDRTVARHGVVLVAIALIVSRISNCCDL